MAYRKLNRVSDQRDAILRTLTTSLLWNGKIVTTEARAKEVRKIAERLITLASKDYKDTVQVTKETKNDKGEKVRKAVTNDGPKKLHARRQLIAYLYNVKDAQKDDETLAEYKDRIDEVKFPVVEKMFREIAPKYEARPGGYTRIVKIGPRRGDAAEMVQLELV